RLVGHDVAVGLAAANDDAFLDGKRLARLGFLAAENELPAVEILAVEQVLEALVLVGAAGGRGQDKDSENQGRQEKPSLRHRGAPCGETFAPVHRPLWSVYRGGTDCTVGR